MTDHLYGLPVGGFGPGSPGSELVEAMVAAWRRGERPMAEDYLALGPALGDEAAIRLVYEEVCLRQEAGLEVDPAEVVARFPQWQAELEVLLDCQRLLQTRPRSGAFPEVGEALGGFRLLAELGRGAAGRVFLASQPSLADRPVVLKITPRGEEEHLCLARLQHMNIMPLYSEQVLLARDLRILCMPYLGGASLARLLDRLGGCPPVGRSGTSLVEALDRDQAALPIVLPAQGSFRRMLGRASYVQAVCWIGACLADGLQYAHDCGLVHMDIKPSNVLLTGDGQPMLLDFHLARGPIAPGGPMPSWLGGTPEYVSPEQWAAMSALRQGRRVETAVDGRSDIYSLGVLLYEALGGPRQRPGDPARLPLDRLNPRVSAGLSDLIRKCLHPEPRDRYPDAASLANDLRRHLSSLPLLGVRNRSLIERWRKWRRRRPAAMQRQAMLVGSAAAAMAAAALLSGSYRQRVHDIEGALGNGRQFHARRQYAEAGRVLRRGLDLAGTTPAVARQRHELAEELRLVRRDWKAAELHDLAELIRFRHGLAPEPSDEARAIVRLGRAIWEARDLLTRPIGGRRDPLVEPTIRADLLDVVTVWADLSVRLAPPGEADEARAEALRRLDDADALLGPGAALDRLRASYAEALGRPVRSPHPASTPRTAWEHCDLGRSYLRSGDHTRAAAEFERALELRPQDFWPNFYRGLCAYQLGRFEDAVHFFGVCIALAPATAECSFNRGMAHEALGQSIQADRDYARALALAPPTDRETVGAIHYHRALVALARGDRPAALSSLEAASDHGHEEAGELSRRLRP
jgi:serine/threonine protein kinase